ncbi:isoprenylcysteine carboxylmethyltransferase family protein [bacterium]|nr:isoprenylcysteine carboxylmethyltransferase family protein [bacterium]
MNTLAVGGLGGQWFLAVLMIVLVSWFVFRYLIPQSWKEWRAAGILQAFIIALYAEMYGFPLTIYVLTAYFGVDIPWLHLRGHLWSSLLGLGDIGAMAEMVLGYAIIFAGIGLLAAGWRQVYKAQKQDKLVTDGLYRYVRHPQYTGIFIAVLGQLVHWPTLLTLILAPLIVLMYWRLAVKEEREMLKKFGAEYAAYTAKTPPFIPKGNAWRSLMRATKETEEEQDGAARPVQDGRGDL